ncbi:uncharacterized protein K460DRAFT_83920 [Cucurbitaria berberidis CBS 394.84]|uniref:Uncharacterized protein n=1 Tax=Cucurbitaria berberidis CBS 394.84 TaxID=1168544 RepID=A0A9P4GPK2_9PLEO|nr:uncharacterized protein K460DRAFT_83920 [Cucurbitaria berberidis CBS 394.84]KAF1848994.1 hypothetical protein K460DRAFT_83920 [Cucurbitaria berberidis CBS 394.84]
MADQQAAPTSSQQPPSQTRASCPSGRGRVSLRGTLQGSLSSGWIRFGARSVELRLVGLVSLGCLLWIQSGESGGIFGWILDDWSIVFWCVFVYSQSKQTIHQTSSSFL